MPLSRIEEGAHERSECAGDARCRRAGKIIAHHENHRNHSSKDHAPFVGRKGRERSERGMPGAAEGEPTTTPHHKNHRNHSSSSKIIAITVQIHLTARQRLL